MRDRIREAVPHPVRRSDKAQGCSCSGPCACKRRDAEAPAHDAIASQPQFERRFDDLRILSDGMIDTDDLGGGVAAAAGAAAAAVGGAARTVCG